MRKNNESYLHSCAYLNITKCKGTKTNIYIKMATDFDISKKLQVVQDWHKFANELSEMPCTKKTRMGSKQSGDHCWYSVTCT